MNERIRALAKEAGLWRQHYDIGEESPERLEKFAELIVQECAHVGYDASYYECASHVSNKIKEHFGVEE